MNGYKQIMEVNYSKTQIFDIYNFRMRWTEPQEWGDGESSFASRSDGYRKRKYQGTPLTPSPPHITWIWAWREIRYHHTLTHRLDLYHHLKKLGTNSATRVRAQIYFLHGAGKKVAQFSNCRL